MKTFEELSTGDTVYIYTRDRGLTKSSVSMIGIFLEIPTPVGNVSFEPTRDSVVTLPEGVSLYTDLRAFEEDMGRLLEDLVEKVILNPEVPSHVKTETSRVWYEEIPRTLDTLKLQEELDWWGWISIEDRMIHRIKEEG